jgi:hypothetical protein
MPDRHGHARDHRTPPSIRRPRVPGGARLVREHGWLTTDHPEAAWYQLVAHSADWSQVRLLIATQPGGEGRTLDVIVRPDGYVVPQSNAGPLGAEAIRIIATLIRAGQRRSDD